MGNNVVKKILLGIVFVILLLPVWNLPPYFSPPDWGKAMTFRILFSALLFFLFVGLIKEGGIPKKIFEKIDAVKLPFLILCLIIVSFLVSSLLALDTNFALWGNPLRGGGYVNFALIVIFALFLFLFLDQKTWKWVWTATLIAGIFVSIIGIFQWQGWLPNIFVARAARPMSTLGNDIQLGIYLILLLFPTLAFALKTDSLLKKLFLACTIFLFLFLILLTGSRGAYLGTGAGMFFFATFFPFKKLWHSIALKIVLLACVLVIGFSLYFVNVQFPNLPREIKIALWQNPTISSMLDRLSLAQLSQEPRFSAWQVSWRAIKEKPLFGWGMEHFATAFDKYYDPKLPNIQYLAGSSNSWWDRGHNLFFDLAVQGGLVGVGLYIFSFLILIAKLQEIKNKKTKYQFEAHGVQSAFIAYLFATLFGFDTFSTYLVLFFVVAYALFLVMHSLKAEEIITQPQKENILPIPTYFKIGMGIVLLLLISIFLWNYTLRPLQVNRDIVLGLTLGEKNNCTPAAFLMERALKRGSTFLDGYLRARYFDVLRSCEKVGSLTPLQIAQKSYALMKEATRFWPYHTRNWIFLGQLANVLVERAGQAGVLTEENKQFLINESHTSFLRAKELSPLHQEIFVEWTKTYIVAQDYEGAKQKARECIEIDPRTGDCWWLRGLAEEFLGERKAAIRDMRISQDKGYDTNTFYALSQLTKAYTANKEYQLLAETYEKLIKLKPTESQFYATLAAVYKELGEFKKAKETALKVLELNPGAKSEVEEFLRTLP